MTTLTEKFQSAVSPQDRAEGEKLAAIGTRLWGSEDRISCEFPDGTTAELFLVKNRLTYRCTSDKPNPYLWATTLLAERFQDLQKSLQRNISKRFFPFEPNTSGGELRYERERQPQIRVRVPKQEAPPPPRITIQENNAIQILFVVRPELQNDLASLPIETWWRSETPNAEGKRPLKPFLPEEGTAVNTPEEAELLRVLAPYRALPPQRPNLFHLPLCGHSPPELLGNIPHLRWCDSREGVKKLHPLVVSYGIPADFHLEITPLPAGSFRLRGLLLSPDGPISFAEVRLVCGNQPGFALAQDTLLPVQFYRGVEIAKQFVLRDALTLDIAMTTALTRTIALRTDIPDEQFPPAVRFPRNTTIAPTAELYVRTAKYKYHDQEQLHAELTFHYGNLACADTDAEQRFSLPSEIVCRDAEAEEQFRNRLRELGFRYATKVWEEEPGWKLRPAQLDEAVQQLVLEDWLVRAEGKTYRKPVTKTPSVHSGTDWFDIKGGLTFDGITPPLPALLTAMKKQQTSVRLDDGTYGLLPREWLEHFTVLTELGDVTGDAIRFRMEQAAIINALLDNRLAEADASMRQKITALEQPVESAPATPPDTFCGTLRPYQQTGLGWLLSMRKAGFGACLADDMGLGKTVQILALLATRKMSVHKPSLAVMPRSLIFNWQAEATKFTPELKTAVHWGANRWAHSEALQEADLVFTTYGTLRNDVERLAKIPFDTCILDESQAIKNAESSTAKAARCIQADHRIAMTGTPIENHLGELFSQLSFLNPGLFGVGSFPIAPSTQTTRENSVLVRIRKAVRPFLLRRTKQEVAKDLPPKTEQILWVELTETEQADYDELLHWYQNELASPTGTGEMQVLAALTRLRQAACHPGLLKEQRARESSSKLDLLCETLEPLLGAGHKAIIFSQFTAFLRIIRARLEEMGQTVCYLDGETKDRAEQVRLFQETPERQLFLISLKAGGVGLNLTAAEYVFLMDPWWNPAAESQAIDRAYRIGQTNPVFAYRLVSKNTIEEKVLKLQQTKKALSDAIVNQDANTPVRLTSELLHDLLLK